MAPAILDRATHLRTELGRGGAGPGGRVLPLWRGKPLIHRETGRLAFVEVDHPVMSDAPEGPVFLGRDDGGGHVAACDLSAWEPPDGASAPEAFADPTLQHHPALDAETGFAEMRTRLGALGEAEAGIAATARGLLEWHRTHRHCARCGAPTAMAEAGWQRVCPACGSRHFPRTDPVVIMLVRRGNSVLVGRAPAWPAGMYSLLAGFVEPGETVETAVRRETFEETGVRIGPVGYLASQPWPFPASLMIGCWADALSGDLTLDPVEIEAALWMTREEMAAAFRGEDPRLHPPRQGAIARFLLWNWLADRLD